MRDSTTVSRAPQGAQASATAADRLPRPQHFSLFRALVPADLITLANAASGTVAAFMLIRYAEARLPEFVWLAMGLMFLAFIFDFADGYVARATHRSSAYGGDLDSLADVISFGLVPAALAYVLGMRGGWDVVILCYFVGCGVARLARFNVTAATLTTDKGKVSHFEGTPIPTSLLIVALLALAVGQGAVHKQLWLGELSLGWTLHPLTLLYAISGTLMITATVKIPKL